MKPGKAYERFVFEKLQRFFSDGVVALNDRILGRESGLLREIDVSVRLNCQGLDLLYLSQCKDWVTKADINVLGELAAVMSDVGAAKGFLLCSAGFRKSNHKYAATKGIELITIEDVRSERWHVTVQVPLVYIRKLTHYQLEVELVKTEAIVELNRNREVTLQMSMATLLRNGTDAPTTVEQYIMRRTGEAREGTPLDLTAPGMELQTAGIWLPCQHFSIVFHSQRITYLKYLTPVEYSQLRDHISGTTLPLHVKRADVSLRLDHTFTEVPEGKVPFYPGLWLKVEESDLIAVAS
jgi:hypothetical protein